MELYRQGIQALKGNISRHVKSICFRRLAKWMTPEKLTSLKRFKYPFHKPTWILNFEEPDNSKLFLTFILNLMPENNMCFILYFNMFYMPWDATNTLEPSTANMHLCTFYALNFCHFSFALRDFVQKSCPSSH